MLFSKKKGEIFKKGYIYSMLINSIQKKLTHIIKLTLVN